MKKLAVIEKAKAEKDKKLGASLTKVTELAKSQTKVAVNESKKIL